MPVTSQSPEKFNDYEGFVDKFKPKLTTDDCYTPPIVYDAIADWVANEYSIGRADFVRPFKPGGDYEAEEYTVKIVVDNPPFSILSKIIDFYVQNGVRFFLFSPTLVGIVRYADKCTALILGVPITYENGARVNTSFVTNLEPHEIRARTEPRLYQAVKEADEISRKEKTVTLPKYEYPMDVITATQMYPLSRAGIDFVVRRDESARISSLAHMREGKKSIFGTGWLLSERERAERERATCWRLSDEELEIIAKLSKKGE